MTLIKKIQSLKNFGIFNHADLSKLPEFKKFNLIYGWNRGGKTTISRLFSSCEKRQLYHSEKFKQFPQNGEFELKLIDDTVRRQVH